MKKCYLCLLLVLILCCMSACNKPTPTPSRSRATSPSATASTTPTQNTKPTTPKNCFKGHTFVDDSDFCTVCGDNYYDVTLKFKIAESREYYTVSGIGTCEREVVKIPEYHYDIPVIGIEKAAFSAMDSSSYEGGLCRNITEVILPPSILEIGENAFVWCTNLETVNIPENVTSIGDSAFNHCTSLKQIVIQAGVTTIGRMAFGGCESLETVVLSKGLVKIEEYAFSDCKALKNIVLPEGLTSIGHHAFASCESLEALVISIGITEIPSNFASDCTSLKSVEIPEGVTRIGNDAFLNCTSLTEVQVPDSLKSMYDNVFEGCTALYQARVYEGMAYVGSKINPYMILIGKSDENRTDVVLHPDTKIIPNSVFDQDTVTSLTINEKLGAVLRGALLGVRGLETIQVAPGNANYHSAGNCLIETKTRTLIKGSKNSVIPDDGSVTSITLDAFNGITGLIYLAIPDAVTEIMDNAFKNCENLEALVIGSGVRKIFSDVLENCGKFSAIYYHGTQSQWAQIEIVGRDGSGGSNEDLLKATLYFYSETPPTGEGNYWHYVDGVPTPWETEE